MIDKLKFLVKSFFIHLTNTYIPALSLYTLSQSCSVYLSRLTRELLAKVGDNSKIRTPDKKGKYLGCKLVRFFLILVFATQEGTKPSMTANKQNKLTDVDFFIYWIVFQVHRCVFRCIPVALKWERNNWY